jgi:hypothetical protein
VRVRGRQVLPVGIAGCVLALAASACTPPGHTKPLTAAVTVGWLNVTNGAQLPSVQSALAQADCNAPHPGTAGGCGSVTVSALIRGFAGYGGTPMCSTVGYPPCDPQSYLTGGVTLIWSLVCTTTQNITSSSQNVTLHPGFQSPTDHVSSLTRVNNDSARLGLVADLPLGEPIGACAGPSRLRSVTVSAVRLSLSGGHRYPRSTFTASGPFTN